MMSFRDYLSSTSSTLAIGVICSILSGCGDGNNNGLGNYFEGSGQSTESDYKLSIIRQTPYMVLVYNGFSALDNTNTYAGTPKNLVKDLSAAAPENLYLYAKYVESVGTKTNPKPQSNEKTYSITLPGSGVQRQTGLTLLDPKLSMTSSDSTISAQRNKVAPTSSNAVFLSIPAGRAERPEAPFFPVTTKYTAVIAEEPLPYKASNGVMQYPTHGPIISIEASASNPATFGALVHQEDKGVTLRFYDSASKVDKAGSTTNKTPRDLLTPASGNETIKARFVSLSADDLPAMSLQSIDSSTFKGLGISSHKLVQLLYSNLPRLVSVEPTTGTEKLIKPIFDANFGVFCLGGKNTFPQVTLTDKTFVYPISDSSKKTTITNLNASRDSGFIIENGRHMDVTTLTGAGSLTLIANLKKSGSTSQPVVDVTNLNGVNSINVGIAQVEAGFVLPASGLPLFSWNASTTANIDVQMVGTHVLGNVYTGDVEVKNKSVVLTNLTRGVGLSSGSLPARALMARHPNTQGIPSRTVTQLITALDPVSATQRTMNQSLVAASHHFAEVLSANTNSVAKLNDHLSVSATNTLGYAVGGVNLNHMLGNINVLTSAYGISNSQKDAVFGASVTAAMPSMMGNAMLVPSLSIGYTHNSLADKALSADDIHVRVSDANVNSVFARLMTSLNHTHEDVSTSLSFGIGVNHSYLSKGMAATEFDSVSLVGEGFNGVHSLVEASLKSSSADFKFGVYNFNQVQIQFGFSN